MIQSKGLVQAVDEVLVLQSILMLVGGARTTLTSVLHSISLRGYHDSTTVL